MRAAILALLAERPMHGYEMLQELARRTQDLWRPSPGSLYPALQLLEDQGLVRSVEADGRRRFELTDSGRAEQTARPAGPLPWETMLGAADPGDMALNATLRQVEVAIGQVAEAGTAEQKTKAEALLAELRRQIYLLLAEPPESPATQPMLSTGLGWCFCGLADELPARARSSLDGKAQEGAGMLTEPRVVQRADQPYVAIKAFVTMEKLGTEVPPLNREVFGWLAQRGVVAAGAPFWKYNVVDMERQLEVEAGAPVAVTLSGDDRVLAGVIPGGEYATVRYTGHPSGLAGATAELLDWTARQGLTWDLRETGEGDRWGARLEIYETDPAAEPDMDKWVTELAFRLAGSHGPGTVR